MAVSPERHANIRRSTYEEAFLAVLPKGRQHALTAKELGFRMAGHVGVAPDARLVRQIASDLRRRGALIGSAISRPYGFYRPADIREAAECRDQLARRLCEVRRTVAAYDRAVKLMTLRQKMDLPPLPGMEHGV